MRKIMTITLLLLILASLLTISCGSSAKGSVLGSELVQGNATFACRDKLTGELFPPQCKEITLRVTVQNIGGDGIVTAYARVNYTVDYVISNNVKYRETKVYLKQGQQNTVLFNFWVPWRETWTYETGTL